MKKDELLLTENSIKIDESDGKLDNKGELRDGMYSILRQKPNSNLWGIGLLPRYKLSRYNLRHQFYVDSPRHKDIRERKVEAPVLVNTVLTRLSDSSLKQFMINNGYYYNTITDSVIELKHQEAKVVYTVKPGKRYYVRKAEYDVQSSGLKGLIARTRNSSTIKKGKVFRNIDLGQERLRLYNLFRNAGYYAFKVENINVEPDTIDRSGLKNALENPFDIDLSAINGPTNQDSVDLYINLFPTRDSAFDKQFTYDKVIVRFRDPFNNYPGRPLQEEAFKDVIFKYYDLPVDKSIIYENIFLHPNDLYATKNVEATYNRLNQLGTFQFVNIQFKRDSTGKNKLNCIIELTLAMKRDIKLNADVSNGEDYLLGFGGGINFNTRNLMRGANKLNFQVQNTVEYRQLNKDKISDGIILNANNFTSSANLTIPRFLLPFKLNTSRNNTPFTIISLAHSRVNRVASFKLVNTTAKLAYTWKETNKKSWLVSPIFLSLTNVPDDKLSDEFRTRIEGSRYLQNTYSNNFIQGENFSFEYRSDLTGSAPTQHTFTIGFEEAGLLMQGVNLGYKGLSGGKEINNIAHYVRADVDYRYYYNRRNYQWATRAMVGIGIPTFGDVSLPYIKQYSQGGAFSNRGWQLRNLGPGRTLPEVGNGRQLVDRTGDLKLELNTELRFPLATIGIFEVKGASFVDAGNIWLFQEDSTNVGGEIRLDKFWQDIAISSGIGLRLDFSFFVFRLDHAWRLKYPYKPENSGWDIRGLRLNDGQWNVAIGYPF